MTNQDFLAVSWPGLAPASSHDAASNDNIIGFALADGRDLRFRAADRRFALLDGSRFRRPEQMFEAVGNLARAIFADLLEEGGLVPSAANDIEPAADGLQPNF